MLKVCNCSVKQVTLRNGQKHKGSGISVNCDYVKEALDKRKALWNSAQERASGKKVTLFHDRLRNDGCNYE